MTLNCQIPPTVWQGRFLVARLLDKLDAQLNAVVAENSEL